MSLRYGASSVISWDIKSYAIYVDLFATCPRDIKEPSGVRVQVNYSRGDWSLTVIDIGRSKKMQLQLKAKLTFFDTYKEAFLQPDWSEAQTFDSGHPIFEFPNHVKIINLQEHAHFSLKVEVRPVYGTHSTYSPKWKLVPAIATMFNDQGTADAEIKVGNSSYKVHKIFLTLQSDVFKSMFEHEFTEKKSNVVQIKDADEEVVEAMLRFVYSGKVENLNEVAERLLTLSDQYQLKGLTDMCMTALGNNLTLENIVKRLQLLAYPEHLNAFKKPLFKFIKQNFVPISALPEWKNFRDEHKEIVDELISYAFDQMDHSPLQEHGRRAHESDWW
ncbi:Speckle-type POZ protein A-like isoform X3 [Aphelenchoides besseyi]|nr:Speckle-type POZ protein A-like isoform X3 [Aphelenchoides besseyi]